MASSSALRPPVGCLSRIGSFSASTRAATFSTTARQCKRKTKDNNKNRGVSSLYGSGPREHLSMSDIPLPKPRDFKPKVAVDENHGLWGFFPETGKALWSPKETEEHGRAWTVEELRKKSWEDLHSLWWVCCKERNMLATSKAELARGKFGFGDREIEARDEEVMKTMRAIKHALTERYYTWQDAVDVAMSDPEIDMHAEDGQVYKPSAYEEEVAAEEAWATEKGVEQESVKAEKELSR
ncbi:54S ribosomal protein L4 mitochondrial [Metarhizium acridum]|uniref:54S ribosomal protein L4 mitochondrial n=1 Tax=Metarhizium acridum TaxID=92637 RepID=UPI001C6CBD0E|nr:54S ribosomal protein L4 mitochondrial [Metarhizium acridum]